MYAFGSIFMQARVRVRVRVCVCVCVCVVSCLICHLTTVRMMEDDAFFSSASHFCFFSFRLSPWPLAPPIPICILLQIIIMMIMIPLLLLVGFSRRFTTGVSFHLK